MLSSFLKALWTLYVCLSSILFFPFSCSSSHTPMLRHIILGRLSWFVTCCCCCCRFSSLLLQPRRSILSRIFFSCNTELSVCICETKAWRHCICGTFFWGETHTDSRNKQLFFVDKASASVVFLSVAS